MIQRIVTYEVRADAVGDVRAAIAEFISGIREREHEPETVAYHAYQYLDAETQFVHTMTFASAEARDFHTGSPHVKRFVEVLYPLCVEPPMFRDIVTVSSSTDPTLA